MAQRKMPGQAFCKVTENKITRYAASYAGTGNWQISHRHYYQADSLPICRCISLIESRVYCPCEINVAKFR